MAKAKEETPNRSRTAPELTPEQKLEAQVKSLQADLEISKAESATLELERQKLVTELIPLRATCERQEGEIKELTAAIVEVRSKHDAELKATVDGHAAKVKELRKAHQAELNQIPPLQEEKQRLIDEAAKLQKRLDQVKASEAVTLEGK